MYTREVDVFDPPPGTESDTGLRMGILTAYAMLSFFRAPGYFAKILPVPFLNVIAASFDRIPVPAFARGNLRFSARWEENAGP